jgi:hypothetical protein
LRKRERERGASGFGLLRMAARVRAVGRVASGRAATLRLRACARVFVSVGAFQHATYAEATALCVEHVGGDEEVCRPLVSDPSIDRRVAPIALRRLRRDRRL